MFLIYLSELHDQPHVLFYFISNAHADSISMQGCPLMEYRWRVSVLKQMPTSITSYKLPINFLSINMAPPQDDENRVYNRHEREKINPFKSDYMKTTNPAERKALAQAQIFPALFNYWSSIGIDLNPEEHNKRSEVSRNIVKWIPSFSICCSAFYGGCEMFGGWRRNLSQQKEFDIDWRIFYGGHGQKMFSKKSHPS